MWWKDRVLVRMVKVKILRSLKVQCLKILEQRIVENVSFDVGPGAFYREDGSVISIPILQLFTFQKVRFLETGSNVKDLY